MNLTGRISDQEISEAIRYLDPDCPDARQAKCPPKATRRPYVQMTIDTVAFSICVIWCIAILRYLLALLDRMN